MTTKWVKRRRARRIELAVFLVALAVFCYSGWRLFGIWREYKKGTDTYDNLASEAEKILSAPDEETPAADGNSQAETENDPKAVSLYALMHGQNPDYVGWITIPDTKIDYPIVQCSDNDHYLKYTFGQEENAAGTLFVDSNITDGMDARHVIIYGHNMKNGSMFAGLKKFREDDFYENHKTFTVYTADHVYTYEIFAVHVTSPDSDAYTIGFGEMADFVDYVNRMQSQSLMNTGVIVGEEDHIMTLSTCVNQNRDRLVIQARRLEN